MPFLLQLLFRNSFFFLFLFLETIAIFLTFRNYNYQSTRVSSSTLSMVSSLQDKRTQLNSYFHLEQNNLALLAENAQLRNQLGSSLKPLDKDDIKQTDSLKYRQKFTYTAARVINNSIHKNQNYITLDKGSKHGIEKNMGVVTSNGVIGKIIKVTNNYSRAISLLNKKMNVNARIRRNHFFGSIKWAGGDSNIVYLNDIPRSINVELNDIIETDGKSTSYPEGIQIGKVIKIGRDQSSGNQLITIRLDQDFGNLTHAYVVKNLTKLEILRVEDLEIEEEVQTAEKSN